MGLSKRRCPKLVASLPLSFFLGLATAGADPVGPAACSVTKRLSAEAEASARPAIGVSGSSIHAAWEGARLGTQEDIFFRTSPDGGSSWRPIVRLSDNPGVSLEPVLAVADDTLHVAWYDSTPGNSEIFYRQKPLVGEDWTPTKRLSFTSGGSTDPAIAVTNSRVHVVWEDTTHGNAEIFHRRSTDGGTTWLPTQRLTRDAADSRLPSVAAYGRDVHTVWFARRAENEEIMYRRSTDGGETWTGTTRLTFTQGTSLHPSVATGADGSRVHVAWDDETPGQREIFYRSSPDRGSTWESLQRVSRNGGSSGLPFLDSGPAALHVTWFDDTPGNREIFRSRLVEPWNSWQPASRLTFNPGRSSNPTLAVSGGRVSITWQDDTLGVRAIFFKSCPIEGSLAADPSHWQ